MNNVLVGSSMYTGGDGNVAMIRGSHSLRDSTIVDSSRWPDIHRDHLDASRLVVIDRTVGRDNIETRNRTPSASYRSTPDGSLPLTSNCDATQEQIAEPNCGRNL